MYQVVLLDRLDQSSSLTVALHAFYSGLYFILLTTFDHFILLICPPEAWG